MNFLYKVILSKKESLMTKFIKETRKKLNEFTFITKSYYIFRSNILDSTLALYC